MTTETLLLAGALLFTASVDCRGESRTNNTNFSRHFKRGKATFSLISFSYIIAKVKARARRFYYRRALASSFQLMRNVWRFSRARLSRLMFIEPYHLRPAHTSDASSCTFSRASRCGQRAFLLHFASSTSTRGIWVHFHVGDICIGKVLTARAAPKEAPSCVIRSLAANEKRAGAARSRSGNRVRFGFLLPESKGVSIFSCLYKLDRF